MTDPTPEFPHEEPNPDTYGPRFYQRDGTPATPEEFEAVFRNRLIAYSTITHGPNGENRSAVSTVFLGLDHAISVELDGGPILFETAVYDGTGLVFRIRSKTESAARSAHASALIDLVAAIETSTRDDPFPTAPAEDDTDDSDSLPER